MNRLSSRFIRVGISESPVRVDCQRFDSDATRVIRLRSDSDGPLPAPVLSGSCPQNRSVRVASESYNPSRTVGLESRGRDQTGKRPGTHAHTHTHTHTHAHAGSDSVRRRGRAVRARGIPAPPQTLASFRSSIPPAHAGRQADPNTASAVPAAAGPAQGPAAQGIQPAAGPGSGPPCRVGSPGRPAGLRQPRDPSRVGLRPTVSGGEPRPPRRPPGPTGGRGLPAAPCTRVGANACSRPRVTRQSGQLTSHSPGPQGDESPAMPPGPLAGPNTGSVGGGRRARLPGFLRLGRESTGTSNHGMPWRRPAPENSPKIPRRALSKRRV